MTPKLILLLLALSFGGTPAAYRQTMVVTAVRSGTVTLSDGAREYEIPEHEAWRAGDRAECIMLTRGTESKEDDTIAHIEYVWEGR